MSEWFTFKSMLFLQMTGRGIFKMRLTALVLLLTRGIKVTEHTGGDFS